MAAPTVVFQAPLPRATLVKWKRHLLSSQQEDIFPKAFRDSMFVREEVFTREQKAVPIKHHTDADDARSYLWVLYAPADEDSSDEPSPIGTVRLVPFPQAHPHPVAGSAWDAPTEDLPAEDATTLFARPAPPYFVDQPSSLHDGIEPYISLGRLCVLEAYRGKRYANLLVDAALTWATTHPEKVGMSGHGVPAWKGLVGILAQVRAKTAWERNGFVVDEQLGTCLVAGMEHVSMFRRLEI
ncbi:hypothetical protein BP6252_08472 [Coleophoma cylindrospora]|uniref:Uncharacterized protein n=1 Tax=Coleophoma cylindrospora TaxID=1849047 RepID=A0A3D8R5X6_9HELO|nr:hypothetical protein BP6252_08472 [Coleophoma cylindrospora]